MRISSTHQRPWPRIQRILSDASLGFKSKSYKVYPYEVFVIQIVPGNGYAYNVYARCIQVLWKLKSHIVFRVRKRSEEGTRFRSTVNGISII